MSDTEPDLIADYEAVPPYGSDPIKAADAVRLLGAARVVLDRCAEDRASRGEAADMAQRIVDLVGHSTTDEPPHALVLIEELADAISEAVDFFVARDEMNAKVHLAEPRWSPITEQCRHALESWRSFRYPELNDGSPSEPKAWCERCDDWTYTDPCTAHIDGSRPSGTEAGRP